MVYLFQLSFSNLCKVTYVKKALYYTQVLIGFNVYFEN